MLYANTLTAFQIHHIFPTELFNDPDVRQQINSIFAGEDVRIFEDAASNTIPLFVNPVMVDAVNTASAMGETFLSDVFGSVSHNGSHPGYNDFISAQVDAILNSTNPATGQPYTPEEQRLALFDLHKFGADLANGRIEDADGNTLTIAGTADYAGVLADVYANQNFDTSQPSSDLQDYIVGFDSAPMDLNSDSNTEARFNTVEQYLSAAAFSGAITPEQFQKYFDLLYGIDQTTGTVEPTLITAGQITSIHIQISYDIAVNTGFGDHTSFRANIERFLADFRLNESGATDFGRQAASDFIALINEMGAVVGQLPDNLGQLGSDVLSSLATNFSSILVGIGGGVIGDTAEFLNLAYDSLKKGLDTGDWSDFIGNVGTYGFALFASAVAITGTVALAGMAGPGAAALVASLWVVFGVIDGLSNIVELVGKIGEDNVYWEDKLADLDFAIEVATDPLVIDMDGDGIELTSLEQSDAFFDLDGDGFAENTGWVSADDALLAIDSNGNGQIDDITELFGSEDVTGYEELAALDSNGDGVINSQDANFDDLLIWQDFNQDGRSEVEELQSLAEAGIAEISLNATETDLLIKGNQVIETASVTFADGSSTQSWEVLFNLSQLESSANLPEGFSLDEAVYTLPYLRGFGDMPDLWVSMTNSPEVMQMSIDLIGEARTGSFSQFEDEFDDMLASWAGVDELVWLQDAEGVYANFVFDAEDIQAIYDEVGLPDYDVGPDGSPGAGGGQSYDGPRPPITAFIFDSDNPEYRLDEQEVNDFLESVEGAAPSYEGIPASYWNFTFTTHPLVGVQTGVSVTGSSDEQEFTISEVNGDVVQVAPSMEVSEFAVLQVASGQDYRLAGNFIAPENVVVATPTEEEISDLQDAYDTVQGYMAARFLIMSVDSILEAEGPDADLGNLSTVANLDYNPFSDRITGSTDDFVVDTIEMFRTDGLGSDVEALEFLAFFAGDIPGMPAIIADEFPDISSQSIEAVFGVDLLEGSPNNDSVTAKNEDVLVGLDGDDTLIGGGGDTGFLGGSGDDLLYGNGPSDTFIYREGDGSDTISQAWRAGDDIDQLIFTDHTSAEVEFSYTGGLDLQIRTDDGQVITIENQFRADIQRIDEIVFSDGISLDFQEIVDRVVEDQKPSGFVNGTIYGDNHYHAVGDGSYQILDGAVWNDLSVDRFFLVDQLQGDVSFDIVNVYDLSITMNNGEQVIIINHFRNQKFDMEQIIFADGTVYDGDAIKAKALADQAATGIVDGTWDGDFYVHTSGMGSYTINDVSRSAEHDRLYLSEFDVDQVVFSQDANHGLVITMENGETITIPRHFDPYRSDRFDIEEIEFADGTVLDLDGITAKSLADQVPSGLVRGTEGEDVYIHEAGMGSYTINDVSDCDATDTIVFNGFDETEVSFSQGNGTDLLITLTNGETITVQQHFSGDIFDLEEVQFSDGSVLTLNDLGIA